MPTASERIPAAVRPLVSERARKTLDLVEKFVNEECLPADPVYHAQLGTGATRWTYPPIMTELKTKARSLGLWNQFLAGHEHGGAGFTNLEYGLMCEQLGRSRTASEATNNAAPDTGNMELLAKYGSEAQKKRWLGPLLEGEIRSCYVMTEPDTASSDATNVQLSIKREGNEYVLNGQKWWISGAGDPRCKVYIVLGKTDPNHADKYKQQSIIIVPSDSPGIEVKRMLSVYGYDDAPHGHAHLIFRNVRVPAENIVLGEGRGFEVMQGRMGPGRIHHAMRSIGAAEEALRWLLTRANAPHKQPFGKQLSEQGVILQWMAKSRIEIDAARLIVLNAAAAIDAGNAKTALVEIAQAKILVPNMALDVIDRAVQTHGAEGICQDTPLAYMWAQVRTVRIADGPDEAHLEQLGKKENKKAAEARDLIQRQVEKTDALFKKYGTKELGPCPRL
ncbi:acyl-CoA dehydrogenase NM domain-like protein [Aaosphaeria arxii CBS 175.79]|uniref:Acyl-CoA dehydrogenase NM domain-like protein n=1 Tax=Aaosphaeria arxii CBS 175.79 TaxID=1450172 RepID=A0A6A5Y925_9PLEO|nr:acyl-CoA dehydrogenase NM domain-like protein [Aaosphaeria arxii CBS 175.79]KAF2022102.1 acyl-CoA dehydrogenase NM domain-like protein [Aaosphaeria arxii CBS 175.79]